MKITVNTTELKNGLKKIKKGISTKGVMPVLKGVLFKAGDTITIISNNLELAIMTELEGDIEGKGSIVIPGNDLIKYINKINANKVTFETNDDVSVTIKAGRGKYNMKCWQEDEFPSKQTIKGESLNTQQDILKLALNKTEYAVSKNETRPALTGVKLNISSQGLGAVATNQFRMSLFNDLLTPEEVENGENIILPGITANVLGNLLGSGEVDITYNKNHIEFKFNDIFVQSRLINGERFPNYKKLIPNDYVTELEVDKILFKNALEKASIVNDEKIIRMEIEDDIMTIIAEDMSQSFEEKIDINKNGDDLKTAFDSSYLLDFIKTSNTENIVIKSAGAMNQWVLKDDWDSEDIYVVMPTR